MDQKNKILELIQTKPKAYAAIIKHSPDLKKWVFDNTLIKSDSLVDHIYSAISGETNVCEFGNIKKVKRISSGFAGCGPAAVCACTKNKISKSVIATKQSLSTIEQAAINEKRSNTMLEKYGVEFNSKRPEIKSLLSKPKIPVDVFEKLNNKEWLNTEYNTNQRTLVDIASELGVYYSTVGEYCRKFDFTIRQVTNYSMQEVEIAEYIRSLGIRVVTNDWSILKTSEIDIVIPDFNIGIEVNGLFWHSYTPLSKTVEYVNKHIDKTTNAKLNGIELLHITDNEWLTKQSIIKNIIKSKLKLNTKLYARRCSIRLVDISTERQFLIDNHLQGYVASKYAVGLYFNNTLVMLVTLGKSRFSKNTNYEILRVCSAPEITVVGGLSKLIKHIKTQIPNESFVTYCDLSKSSGNSYKKVGMTYVSSTDPGYFWTDGNIVISRFKTFKKTLVTWLLTYDPSKTVDQNMFDAKYRKYWDCGNAIFTFTS